LAICWGLWQKGTPLLLFLRCHSDLKSIESDSWMTPVQQPTSHRNLDLERTRLKMDAVVGFTLCHSLAILALFPYFFSWTGVVLFFIGVNLFGVLGLNVGFHRLLTHRGFSCPLWLEHTLAIFGTCSLEFSPALWVAIHRRHHHFSDEEPDPHSPNEGFFWSHFGWLLRRTGDMKSRPLIERYGRDLMRDPLYAFLERRKNWIVVAFSVWLLYFFAGAGYVLATGGSNAEAVQFGASLLVWGGALRTIFVWHTTWAVNSVAHIWGYRNYETSDNSRNNVLIGILAAGEGWHNNHHADPKSARHGHRWWEIDFTWIMIRCLMAVGLAWDVAQPSPALANKDKAA
jgi:fatty-acid desaturase